MNKNYFYILTISIFILSNFYYNQQLKLSHSWKRQKQSVFLKEKFKDLKESKFQKNDTSLFYSLMTGDKRYLNKKTKKEFKELGLMHLLTPSGLHLSSVLIIFKLFPKWIHVYLLSLLTIPIFMLDKYYSIKRVLIFKISYSFIGKTIENKTTFAFILTFLIDIIIGNFSESPLSSTYSFLFWGTIIFHKGNILCLNNKLFLNLVVTSMISSQPVNVISFFINSIISSIFTLIYPLLCLNFWIPIFEFQTIWSLNFIHYFQKMISFFYFLIPSFYPTIIHCLLLLIIITKLRKYFLIFLIIIMSEDIGNKVSHQISNKKYIYSPKFNKKCKWKFKEFYYDIKCKKKRP